MAIQSASRSESFDPPGLGPLVKTVLVFLLTLLMSIIVVALLTFAQRGFVDPEGTPITPSLHVYMMAVQTYFQGLLHGNLGQTYNGRQVSALLAVSVRHSLQLLGVSVTIAVPVGLLWGGLLVTAQHRWPRLILHSVSTLALSLPSFVVLLLATQAVASFTQRTHIQLAYVQGYGLDRRHLVLPVTVLVLRGAAFMARSLAVAQTDVLRQDWIRVARAKGLGGLRLWYRHVLPALRLPLIGSTLGMLRVVVGGFVIVDYMYGWGGLGRALLRVDNYGISAPDSDLGTGAAIMLVIFFVITDTLGRLLVRHADPRLQERANDL